MKKENLKMGIIIILFAALGNSLGQLALKFGTNTEGVLGIVWYAGGFSLAALGAVLMMVAFRYGEVSILQPIMSVSYVYSFIFGILFLSEGITTPKVIGTVLIMLGAIVMSLPDKKKKGAK